MWRIYSQAEKLEDTFLRFGVTLPNIKMQREAIAGIVFKSINNKLSTEHNFDEIITAATELLEFKGLNQEIVSEIQNPRGSSIR